jgi:2,4-dienoyl-CoA reductase-like NADH-dependent reductase (Old Yellow Enzyme family)
VHDTSGFADDGGRTGERLRRLLGDMRARMPGTPFVLAGGMTRGSADELIGAGAIDLAAFGQPYISNPDLVERFRTGTPLTPPDRATYFGGDATGYVDYPAATDSGA